MVIIQALEYFQKYSTVPGLKKGTLYSLNLKTRLQYRLVVNKEYYLYCKTNGIPISTLS